MTTAHSFSSLKVFFVGSSLLLCATSHLFFHASSSIAAGFATHLPISISIPVLRIEDVYVSIIHLGSADKKSISVVVSTGSNFNWVLCIPCDCYLHDGTNFNPRKTTKLNCINNQYCSSLPGNGCDENYKCKYTYKFHDQSYVDGILSTDRVRFSHRRDPPNLENFIFGCTHKTHGSFSKNAGGMIGLGRAPLSLTSQLKLEIFSYCLPSRVTTPGWLNFDPADHAPDPEAVTTDLIDIESNLYKVMLMSITVQGDDHPIIIMSPHARKLVIDTGTSLTYIDDGMMKNLIDAVTKSTPYHPVESPLYDLCFDIGEDWKKPQLPGMTFNFKGSAAVHLSVPNIFMWDGETLMCLSIVSNARIGGEHSILGSQAQKGHNNVVDLKQNKFTFGQWNEC